MAKIIFVEPDGAKRVLNSRGGRSLMEIAIDEGLEGILAECGGACSCSTCHVYVDEAWIDRLEPASALEREVLAKALDRRPNSRLSCQIKASEALDGLIVRIPAAQASILADS